MSSASGSRTPPAIRKSTAKTSAVSRSLLDKVADLDFPQNPLDALIARFGVGNVAEISGRMHRFENDKYVRRKLNGVPRRELNEHETRLFQQGRKRLAVISGAGSTGISVHADMDAKNQQRRVFYAFQLSWSADQQMQAFGRVHRSNQSSAPVIRLVLLDLAGQKRLVNAVSKRLGGSRRPDQRGAAFAGERPVSAGRCHRRIRQSGPGTALPGDSVRPTPRGGHRSCALLIEWACSTKRKPRSATAT